MSNIPVGRLRQLFGVTEEVLARRARVGDYIQSFAALIVDAFFDDHLGRDPGLVRHVGMTDIVLMKKSVKEYLVALFRAPLDEAWVDRTANVGIVHFSMHIEPAMMCRGFDYLQQIICGLAEVNEQVRADLSLILKFLKISEHIMIESYHCEARNQENALAGESALTEAFDRLFHLYARHKAMAEQAVGLFDPDRREETQAELQRLSGGSAPQCPGTAIIGELEQWSQEGRIQLDLDLVQAQEQHGSFHASFDDLVEAIEAGCQGDELTALYNRVRDRSDALMTTIGKPLQDITAISFLAVNSGFRFIQKVSQEVSDRQVVHQDHRELTLLIEQNLPSLLEQTMGWCIERITVTREPLSQEDHDLVAIFPLRSVRLFLGLDLKDLPNRIFLDELLQMMLELVRINLLNKERETSLLELADSSERASQAKNAFLANMSHELRTPLNSIIGFSQILEQRSDLPDTLRPFLGKIRIAGNNLLTLVNTILDFAKLEAGKIVCEPRMSDFQGLLREVVMLVQPLAEAKSLQFQHPEPDDSSVVMDPQLIKQVLLNLLSNAVKFTQPGGRIWLDLKFCEQRAAYELSVGDTGTGIARSDFKDLFSPFKQLENPMQKSAQGTGLGLSIARRIVEDHHGGVLSVESELGKGSVFTFTLPLRRADTFVRRHPGPNPEAPHLLIVEDSEEYLGILVNALSPTFHLTVTNSVNRARKLLSRETFDHHVLDFFLVDGICTKILEFMQENGVSAPSIIISAEDDSRILTSLQESELVEGIFSKGDVEVICAMLTRVGAR